MATRTRSVVEEWAAANPRSYALHEQARAVLPGGITHDVRRFDPFPISVVRAEGSRKWDADGHELVCYVMGHGSLLFGHSHPAVVEAVREQAGLAFHPGACHELERNWAEEVVRLVPCAERVRFTSSGTEATLLGLQIARAFTGRQRIVKLQGHFHGWHDYADFGVDPPWERPSTPGIPSAVADAVTVVPPELGAVEAALADGNVAAVILEPSGAAWGAIPLPEGFLAGLREATRAAGTLLIFDEVVTGFRWSPGGVQGHTGVTPDLTALAKILAGGLPGGAICGRGDIMDVLAFRTPGETKVSHPGTHNAHPLSAAAGTTTLRLAADGSAQDRAAATAAALRSGFDEVFRRRGVEALVYGERATFIMVIGVSDDPREVDPAILKRGMYGPLYAPLHCAMLLEGIQLFRGCGLVSAVHTYEDVERTLAAFDRSLARLQDEGLLG
jgi:glutamate-1-semialdehyde 2,1-aminomutase